MNKEKISRRNFLKSSAFSAAILGTAAAGCAPKSAKPASPASEGPTGKMTYRKDPKT
jgi:nitrous oxide reductase